MNKKMVSLQKTSLKLILVEDSHGDALLIQRAFNRRSADHELTVTTTGEEALGLLHNYKKQRSNIPDIILLDLNLPGMKGLEVLKKLKKDSYLRRIPVIILSSSRAESDVINCYNNYANCYIKKASTLEELYEMTGQVEAFWLKHVVLPIE